MNYLIAGPSLSDNEALSHKLFHLFTNTPPGTGAEIPFTGGLFDAIETLYYPVVMEETPSIDLPTVGEVFSSLRPTFLEKLTPEFFVIHWKQSVEWCYTTANIIAWDADLPPFFTAARETGLPFRLIRLNPDDKTPNPIDFEPIDLVGTVEEAFLSFQQTML